MTVPVLCPKCDSLAACYDPNKDLIDFKLGKSLKPVNAKFIGYVWENGPWESNETGTAFLSTSDIVGQRIRCNKCEVEWNWRPLELPKHNHPKWENLINQSVYDCNDRYEDVVSGNIVKGHILRGQGDGFNYELVVSGSIISGKIGNAATISGSINSGQISVNHLASG